MQLVAGDSNLQEFYEFTDKANRQNDVNWNSFDLRDINVDFSRHEMAILTFYADILYSR